MGYCGGANDIQVPNWFNGLQAADHYFQDYGLGREVLGAGSVNNARLSVIYHAACLFC